MGTPDLGSATGETSVSESDLRSEVLLALSHGSCRLFRTNAGLAWQGTVIQQSPTRLVLAYPRPIKLGAPGIADLTGWSGPDCRYTAIELKYGRTRTTDQQLAFIELVLRSGGRAGIARSVEDAERIITGGIS
jgi:hypothetical protein